MSARLIFILLFVALAGCTSTGPNGSKSDIPEWNHELGAAFHQQRTAQTANPQPDTDYIPTGMDGALTEEVIRQYRSIEKTPEKQSGINLNISDKKK